MRTRVVALALSVASAASALPYHAALSQELSISQPAYVALLPDSLLSILGVQYLNELGIGADISHQVSKTDLGVRIDVDVDDAAVASVLEAAMVEFDEEKATAMLASHVLPLFLRAANLPPGFAALLSITEVTAPAVVIVEDGMPPTSPSPSALPSPPPLDSKAAPTASPTAAPAHHCEPASYAEGKTRLLGRAGPSGGQWCFEAASQQKGNLDECGDFYQEIGKAEEVEADGYSACSAVCEKCALRENLCVGSDIFFTSFCEASPTAASTAAPAATPTAAPTAAITAVLPALQPGPLPDPVAGACSDAADLCAAMGLDGMISDVINYGVNCFVLNLSELMSCTTGRFQTRSDSTTAPGLGFDPSCSECFGELTACAYAECTLSCGVIGSLSLREIECVTECTLTTCGVRFNSCAGGECYSHFAKGLQEDSEKPCRSTTCADPSFPVLEQHLEPDMGNMCHGSSHNLSVWACPTGCVEVVDAFAAISSGTGRASRAVEGDGPPPPPPPLDCPCLTAYPTGVSLVSGEVQVVAADGVSLAYPGTYGLHGCDSHDSGLEPSCNSTGYPGWCEHEWCYVDPAACNTEYSTTAYVVGATLHYSYRACGVSNEFESWFYQPTFALHPQ